MILSLAPVAVVACVGDDSSTTSDSGADATSDGLAPDSATDAGVNDSGDAAACNTNAPFEPPTPVPGLTALGSAARLSADELTAYFALAVGDAGLDQLYQASRAKLTDAFGAPTPLATLNDSTGESTPYVSSNGLTIFYGYDENTVSGRDIYYATRANTLGSFQTPQPVGIINDPTHEDDYVSQSSNGDLWFSSRRNDAGVNQIVHAVLVGAGFGTPTVEAELNSLTESNLYPVLTGDLRRIFFQRGTSATIWTAVRAAPGDTFGTPQAVTELNIDGSTERPSWVSADGCRLYVAQGTPVQMFVAQRPPP